MVDGDHPLRAHQEGGLNREKADRSAAPDRDGVARLDVGIFGRLPAGGENIREEKDLVILKPIGNDDRPDVGKWNPDIFGLPPGIAAGQMAVAEQSGHWLTIHFLADILIVGGIAVIAGGILVLGAMVAAPAGDGERHHHPLPLLQGGFCAGLYDFAHELMAKDVARFHGRDVAIVKVQVRTAYGGRTDLDDGVARIEDFRVVDGIDADIMLAVPGERAHQFFSSASCCAVRAAVATSPVSMSCLKRRRSRRAWMAGSRWNILATILPMNPAGGS